MINALNAIKKKVYNFIIKLFENDLRNKSELLHLFFRGGPIKDDMLNKNKILILIFKMKVRTSKRFWKLEKNVKQKRQRKSTAEKLEFAKCFISDETKLYNHN